jgi:hypothetical protein
MATTVDNRRETVSPIGSDKVEGTPVTRRLESLSCAAAQTGTHRERLYRGGSARQLTQPYGSVIGSYIFSGDAVGAVRAMEVSMAELSEDEKQSLDDALSTLDDLYEATLKPDGGFGSEEMQAIAKLAEEAMGCVLSVLDPEMYDAVQRDCPGENLGRDARRFAVQA